MMKHAGMILSLTGGLAGMSVVGQAQANIRIDRGTVIPIVVESNLNLRQNRVGDRFTARVDSGRDLPWGTQFLGKITAIRDPRGDRPGFMDLEFFEIRLPDGSTQPVKSIIVSMERNGRAKDGRVLTEVDDSRSGVNVIGGAVGGAVLGSIIRKPVEGAIIGILGGIIASETNRDTNSSTVLRKGQKFGALLERDIRFSFGGEFRKYRSDADGRREDEARRQNQVQQRKDEGRATDRKGDENRTDDWRAKDRMEEHQGRGQTGRPNSTERLGDVSYKGKAMSFSSDEQPYFEGDCLMVPLQVTASQLDLDVDAARGQIVYIESEKVTVRINRESNECRISGRKFQLAKPIAERRGTLFVPAEIFRELRGNDFKILRNGDR